MKDPTSFLLIANTTVCIPDAILKLNQNINIPLKSYNFMIASEVFNLDLDNHQLISYFNDHSLDRINAFLDNFSNLLENFGKILQPWSENFALTGGESDSQDSFSTTNSIENFTINLSCQNITICGDPVCLGSDCTSYRVILPMSLIFLLMLMIVVGNILVIKILFSENSNKFSSRFTRYNMLKVSLAVSDLRVWLLGSHKIDLYAILFIFLRDVRLKRRSP